MDSFVRELTALHDQAVPGQTISGNTIRGELIFYNFTKGETYIRITTDKSHRVSHYCFRYYNNERYHCSLSDCLLCSSKDLPPTTIFIDGSCVVPKFLFDRYNLTVPTDITIIDNSPVTYCGVTEITTEQFTFKFRCCGINRISCCENYADKRFVEKIWVRPIDLCMVKMYPAVKEVMLINPGFSIIPVKE